MQGVVDHGIHIFFEQVLNRMSGDIVEEDGCIKNRVNKFRS